MAATDTVESNDVTTHYTYINPATSVNCWALYSRWTLCSVQMKHLTN